MSVRAEINQKLLTAMQVLLSADSLSLPVKTVMLYDKSIINAKEYSTPIVCITDGGKDEVLVKERTASRITSPIQISIEVRDKNSDVLLNSVHDVCDAVRLIIEAQPDLGPNCLGILWQGVDAFAFDPKEDVAGAACLVSPIYVQTTGLEAATTPTPFGPQFITNAQAKIIALLDALKGDLGLVAVYDHHNVADLRLPSVSVGVEGCEVAQQSGTRDIVNAWMVSLSVRVHTAYAGGAADEVTSTSILNSIISKFAANWVPVNDMDINGISNPKLREEFGDSATTGGSLDVIVQVNVDHTQET